MNQKSIIAVLIAAIVFVGAVYFVMTNKTNQLVVSVPKNEEQLSEANKKDQEVTNLQLNETINWKTFISKQEGFALKYPSDWKLEDGDGVDCGVDGLGCPQRVTFTSPDGIIVRYVQLENTISDKLLCGSGTGSPCLGNKVIGFEKINVPNFGDVYFIKETSFARGVRLHMPLSLDTIPVVGENKHSNFDIEFNLPSKNGKRYILFLSLDHLNRDALAKFGGLKDEQFYNLDSVRKGILILKSLTYY